MITFTVVAILGFLLAIVLLKLFQKPKPALPPPRPVEDLANLSVAQARPGDAISVAGSGDDFADLDFVVDRRLEYDAGGRRWFELSGMYRERRVALQVGQDDDLDVAVIEPKNPALDELGLSEQDLASMDERQNAGDHFEFEGKHWFYRFSREVTSPSHAPFYCWRFEEDGGKRLLTIRKPEGEPFSAVVAARVKPGDVTVYRK